MSLIQIIFSFIGAWFLISIPASLFIGWFMSIRDCPEDENQNIPLAPTAQTDYSEMQQLDEAI